MSTPTATDPTAWSPPAGPPGRSGPGGSGGPGSGWPSGSLGRRFRADPAAQPPRVTFGLGGEPAAYRPPAPATTDRVTKPRPSAVAAGSMAMVAVGLWWFARSSAPLVAAVTLVVALIADAVLSRRGLAGASLELRNPPDAVAGGHVSYLLRAVNLRRPLLVLPAGPFRQHAVLVEHDGPGTITLPAPPRGVVRYLLLDLISTGPFGFTESMQRALVPLPVPMLVAPPLLVDEPVLPPNPPLGFGEVERARVGDDLFRSVRPYQRGDAQRRVHWPTTARTGELMVRETDGTGVVPVRIVLVMRQPGPRSEVAAGRAAYLAEMSSQRGWAVHLVTVENPGEPVLPRLGMPLTYLPRLLPPPAIAPVTVDRLVQRRTEVARRLSTAGYGQPMLEPWPGLTRVISAEGDRWE